MLPQHLSMQYFEALLSNKCSKFTQYMLLYHCKRTAFNYFYLVCQGLSRLIFLMLTKKNTSLGFQQAERKKRTVSSIPHQDIVFLLHPLIDKNLPACLLDRSVLFSRESHTQINSRFWISWIWICLWPAWVCPTCQFPIVWPKPLIPSGAQTVWNATWGPHFVALTNVLCTSAV